MYKILPKLALNTKQSINRVSIYSTDLNYERQKHNTIRVLLKTNNLNFCLNHEYLKSVLHIKKNFKSQKTT